MFCGLAGPRRRGQARPAARVVPGQAQGPRAVPGSSPGARIKDGRRSRTSSTSGSCWRRSSTSSTRSRLMALVAASVMAVAALLLVGNTIQVAAYSKRREVAVMKLVGASNWFIQAPFVLEAVVAGVFGFDHRLRSRWSSARWLLLDGSLAGAHQPADADSWRQRVDHAAADGRRRRPGQRDHRLGHAPLLPAGLAPTGVRRWRPPCRESDAAGVAAMCSLLSAFRLCAISAVGSGHAHVRVKGARCTPIAGIVRS